MTNKIDLKEVNELKAILNVLNMVSLNVNSIDTEGFTVEHMDLLGDDREAKFTRLKAFLISVCKNVTQIRVIELLSQQYDIEDIANELGYTQEYVRRTVREIRKKCLRLQKKSN